MGNYLYNTYSRSRTHGLWERSARCYHPLFRCPDLSSVLRIRASDGVHRVRMTRVKAMSYELSSQYYSCESVALHHAHTASGSDVVGFIIIFFRSPDISACLYLLRSIYIPLSLLSHVSLCSCLPLHLCIIIYFLLSVLHFPACSNPI